MDKQTPLLDFFTIFIENIPGDHSPGTSTNLYPTPHTVWIYSFAICFHNLSLPIAGSSVSNFARICSVTFPAGSVVRRMISICLISHQLSNDYKLTTYYFSYRIIFIIYNLFINLVFSKNPITNCRKYNSSGTVYYHCHIWPPYYHISYTVGSIGLEREICNFGWE